MNETFLSRIGKLFFPHLAPDQRHRRMVIIIVVIVTCLSSVGVLISWMMSTRGIHIATSPGLPSALK